MHHPHRLRQHLWRFLAAVTTALPVYFLTSTSVCAAVVEMKDGKKVVGEQVIYTYTNVVVITSTNNLHILPNGDVKTVDGVPFAQAYWGDKPISAEALDGPSPQAAVGGAWPVQYGTVRRYNLAKQVTTWVRRGGEMQRRTTTSGTGDVLETVSGVPKDGRVTLTETITEKQQGHDKREVRLTDQIEPRADGYYLLGQVLEDDHLRQPKQVDRISTPPRLWPNQLNVGQTWIVGPFERFGINQVGRMEVVGRESIVVPAGTFHDAFKVVGHGHVFAGTQLLKAGRLVTDHGTLETVTWFVAGVGPVKEESRLHLHQTYFPEAPKGDELPLVVEEVSTRALSEYQIGK